MQIMKLSVRDRRNSRNLIAMLGNGMPITEVFESLDYIVDELKKIYHPKYCAYTICNDGEDTVFDGFDYRGLNELVANMLLDSFYTVKGESGFVLHLGYGKTQKIYRLIGSEVPFETKNNSLAGCEQYVILTCNGVFRLLTVDEVMQCNDTDFKNMYEEDQII